MKLLSKGKQREERWWYLLWGLRHSGGEWGEGRTGGSREEGAGTGWDSRAAPALHLTSAERKPPSTCPPTVQQQTNHHLAPPAEAVTPGRGKCPGGRNYWGPLRARQQRHRSQQSEWTQSGERESRPGIPNQWVQSGNLSQSTLRTLRLTEKHREKLQQLIWLNRVAVRGMVSQKVRFPTVMNILIMR